MNPYLSQAIQAALLAGKEIMQIYTDPTADFQIEKKSDQSPLTIADKRAHLVIEALLVKSGIPVLSEEGKTHPYEERKNWERLWIVDPLDGTKEFIKRNGDFTVNIALVDRGTPILGVIYAPVLQTLYWGSIETGAYRVKTIDANQPLPSIDSLEHTAEWLPLPTAKSDYVVVASRSHLTPETALFIDELKLCYPAIRLESKGSSLKLCMVADGSADIYPRFAPTMEWDTAAGHAIIKAAGKEVYLTDQATPLIYNKEDLLNPWFVAK